MLGFKVRTDATFFSNKTLKWSELRRAYSSARALPSPVQLHLVRHGETETNVRSLITGSQDVPLTPSGKEQARRIGRQLDRRYQLALHSTLSRSRQTLLLALEEGDIKIDRICADPRLNERSLGELELQPRRSLEEYARGDLHFAPRGGDSYGEVARRCLSFLLDLFDFAAAELPERVLICSHMGPMRILLGILERRSDPVQVLARSFENTEVVRLAWKRLEAPGFLKTLFGASARPSTPT